MDGGVLVTAPGDEDTFKVDSLVPCPSLVLHLIQVRSRVEEQKALAKATEYFLEQYQTWKSEQFDEV